MQQRNLATDPAMGCVERGWRADQIEAGKIELLFAGRSEIGIPGFGALSCPRALTRAHGLGISMNNKHLGLQAA